MPPTLPLHRCAFTLAVVMLLLLPARLAADLVWTPESGWRFEGGVISGLGEAASHRALTLMNKARVSEEKHHYRSALRNYQKVTKRYGDSFYAQEAFYHTALIRQARHQYLKAFKAFQEIISRFPNTPKFNELIGRQYRIACDLLDGARNHTWVPLIAFRNREASVGLFEIVVANAPYSEYAPLALMSIAKAHQVLRNPEESIYALDRMINTYPKSLLTPDAYLRSAQSYASMVTGPDYDQTATKEAITYFEDFVILYPGDRDVAIAEKGMVDMKSELAESKMKIADYYLKYRRNYKAAKVFFNEAITDYPDSPVAARAKAKLTKVDELLAEQEKTLSSPAGNTQQAVPHKRKRFIFF